MGFKGTHKITLLVLDTVCHLFTFSGKGRSVRRVAKITGGLVLPWLWEPEVWPLVDGSH